MAKDNLIYFRIEPLEALEIESKLLRSERLALFTTRTEGGDDSLFLLLRLKFLLPPMNKADIKLVTRY